jgi:glycosyltransferase involved in cell wall biosynthesis
MSPITVQEKSSSFCLEISCSNLSCYRVIYGNPEFAWYEFLFVKPRGAICSAICDKAISFLWMNKSRVFMKKKILLIDDNYHSPDSGAFLNVFERNFLIENGYDVYTFSFPNKLPPLLSANDYIYRTSKNWLFQKLDKFIGNRNMLKSLKDAVEKIKPDLVHCHLLSKYPADVYRALDAKIPIIQTLHGPNLFCATSWGCRKESLPCEMGIGMKCYLRGCMPLLGAILYCYLNARTWKNLVDKVTVFHCPSRNIMNTALRLGIKNVVHIPPCISDTFISANRVKPTGNPTVIFVGSLEKCKGIDNLIDAIHVVLKAVPNAKLRIAGKGSLYGQLLQRTKELQIDSSVVFLGHVPHATLLKEYSNSDLLVLPSVWQEQFGLVGPEAMACGLPCIGSDIGGIPEWLSHDTWGMLVPPGNVEHLAAAMIKYLSNRDYAYNQGLIAQEYARTHYNSISYGKRLIELFDGYMVQ